VIRLSHLGLPAADGVG